MSAASPAVAEKNMKVHEDHASSSTWPTLWLMAVQIFKSIADLHSALHKNVFCRRGVGVIKSCLKHNFLGLKEVSFWIKNIKFF